MASSAAEGRDGKSAGASEVRGDVASVIQLGRGRLRSAPVARLEPIQQVVVGIAFAVLGAAVRIVLGPLASDVPFLTLFPAVALSAWAAGFIGGLAAAIASALLAALLFLAPAGSLDVTDQVALIGFFVGSLLIAGLGGHLHTVVLEADTARRRAAFLADATALLASRLDPAVIARSLAAMIVPVFADWCAIDLLDDDERLGRVASAGDRPASEPRVAAVLPPVPSADAMSPDGEAAIAVPLIAGGRAVGALTLAMTSSRRRFTGEDVAIAIDLGARAGIAVDHARLFGAVRARRDELDAVIRTMSDAVLVADEHGDVRSHNPAAERILGPAIPERLDEILDGLVPRGHPAERRAMLVPATHRFVAPVVIELGNAGRRIAILRDMTELLEGEAARDAFIGMLSHELRTPITTIFGAARVLQRPLDEDVRSSLLADLAEETDRLHRLVEDLLVLSRFERGRLEILTEPVLLGRLLARIVASERGRWPSLDLRLDAEPGLPPVAADPTYVEQVVRNLVSNAGKYAGAAASVVVRARHTGDFVTLDVEDDGPGIEGDDSDRIFKLYERITDPASATPGAGIGLFVCRSLVEAMGGTISVERGGRGGARFRFTLPLVFEEVDAAADDAAGRSDAFESRTA